MGADSLATERKELMDAFLKQAKVKTAKIEPLSGDASCKRFFRVHTSAGDSRIIMEIDPLAGGEPEAFCAVAHILSRNHWPVPSILHMDLKSGFVLMDDLGDQRLTAFLANAADQEDVCYRLATQRLIDLQAMEISDAFSWADGQLPYRIRPYSQAILLSEVRLFLSWYIPGVTGRASPDQAINEFMAIWRGILVALEPKKLVPVHKDYHADNIMIQNFSDQQQPRLTIIDFQDMLLGHPAYDLASLLLDARRDLQDGLETTILDFYCQNAGLQDEEQRQDFMVAYHLLGLQRNFKILGIFARLYMHMRREEYLAYLPRVWRYIEATLENCPQADILKEWLDRWLPPRLRHQDLILPSSSFSASC